jgi:hypothetical protein
MTKTTYDSRRIQQEGRQFDKPSQERCNKEESREGKAGKILKEKKWWQGRENQIMKQHWLAFEINAHTNFPDWSNAKPCEKCGKCFITESKKANRFCSIKCFQLFQIDRWFNCSKCHASLGLTTKQSGVILRISATSIGKQWGNYGIKTKKPHTRGWQAMNRASLKSQISIFHKEWMIDVRSNVKFPDWSSLWYKEKAKRKDQSYYSAESYYKRACYTDVIIHNRKSIYPDWSALWTKSRMSYSPQKKAKDNMRTRLKQIMKTVKKGGSFSKSSILGCTTKEFAKHLESKFNNGMTWDNYGTHWHVDHIIPCAAFDHSDLRQIKQCWHWTNMQPLIAKDNIMKSDKLTEPQMQLLLCATN